jgi:iron complex transport system permease protein
MKLTQTTTLTAWLLAFSLLAMVCGVFTGSLGWEWGMAWYDPIVQDIRLPRTLGAWLAGALLGLAGALAQGLFRNPLADPYLLGSASGASLGVAVALTMGLWGGGHFAELSEAMQWSLRLGLTGMAFVGAWLAVLLTLVLAKGVEHTLRLLLAGVVVGVVLGALTSLLTLVSPQILPAMQSFLLGNTSMLNWQACGLMGLVWLLCATLAWLFSSLLDGLRLGESTARSLGLRVLPMRVLLLAVMGLATATAVAQTGLIAFVGLVAPHLVKARVAGRSASLLVLSSLMGGMLLTTADVLARGLWAPHELPVGVLTGVLGGSYLLWRIHVAQQRADSV